MAEAQAHTNGTAPPAPPPAADDGEQEAPDLISMLTGEAELPEGMGPGDDDTDGDEGAVEDGEPATGDEEQESDPAAAAAKEVEGDEEANRAAEEAAFSDAALKTKDGLKRARELVLAGRKGVDHRQKRLDRFDSRLHKREKKQNAEIQAKWNELEPKMVLAQRFDGALRQMQTGTAAERLAALSYLSGVPGLELLEELNMGVLADGKKPPPSRELRNLQARFEALQNELAQKTEREKHEKLEAERSHKVGRVEHHRQEAAELGTDAEKYPAIAAEIEKWGDKMAADVGDWVVRHITDHFRKTGVRLDKPTALGKLNARLAAKAGEPRKGSSVRDPAKSPVAQRRSAGRGVTVQPDLADRSTGSARELSRDERIDELARDRDALHELGLGAFAE